MLGVAFYFGGPADVTLDEDARRVAVERGRCRGDPRGARSDLRRLNDIGDDLLSRGARACADPCERDRGPHAREEVSACDRVARRLDREREVSGAYPAIDVALVVPVEQVGLRS